jgi:hypothetical protein
MSQYFLKRYTLKGGIQNSKHSRTLGQHVRSRLRLVHAGPGSGLYLVGKEFYSCVFWLVPLVPTTQRTLLRRFTLATLVGGHCLASHPCTIPSHYTMTRV